MVNRSYAILLFLLTCRIIAMYCIPLNDTTEARYAEIARKMVETQDWVTLWHAYGIPFWAKPPLSTWLSALSMQLFGMNEFAVRLPSLFLSLGILWLVKRFCLKVFNPETAKLAIILLASSLFFFIDAGAVMTDPSLLFSTTLACFSFWEGFVLKKYYGSYVFFASLGFGLLAKGPLMLVLTGLPIFFWAILYRQMGKLKHDLPWIPGILLTLCIALPWYLIAELHTPGFLQYFIIGEHFGRFLMPGWAGDKYGFAHQQALGMIWLYFILGLMPWSVTAFRLLCKKSSLQTLYNSPLLAYLGLWTIMPLIFFSFARNIIYTYAFTALPAAAILVAYFLNETSNKQNKVFVARAFSAGILALVVSIASITLPQKVNNSQKFLIQSWANLAKAPNDTLLYWSNSKIYSAEFYAKGHLRYLTTLLDLQKYVAQPGTHYLVFNQEDRKKIPQTLMQQMQVIYAEKNKTLVAITTNPSKIKHYKEHS